MPKIVDHERRRRDIAAAATRIVSERGLEGTTVREIASEAGFATGILAHYFRDKDEVIAHAVEQLDERSVERFRPALTSDNPIEFVFEEGMPLDADREVDTRVRIQFWGRALANPELSKQQNASFRSWIAASRALLQARQARGELDEDLKVDPMAEVLAALVIGASVMSVFMPKRARRAFVRRVVDTATHALL